MCARLGTTHAARRLGPVVAPRADRALSPRNRSKQRRTVDPRRDRRSGRVAEHRTAARRDVRHRRLDPQRLARALVRVDRHRMPEYVTSSAIARDLVSVARRRCKLDARRHDVCGRSLVRGAFFCFIPRGVCMASNRAFGRASHTRKSGHVVGSGSSARAGLYPCASARVQAPGRARWCEEIGTDVGGVVILLGNKPMYL